MPRFYASVTYCKNTGDIGHWSRLVVASDIELARARATRAFIARHRSATKIDMR